MILWYSAGIDWCIFHNCLFPKYFLSGYIVDEQIKRMVKNVNQQNIYCTTPPSQQKYIKLFYRNQMHYNYKSDEKILKSLIHRNILPIDPNKKNKTYIL